MKEYLSLLTAFSFFAQERPFFCTRNNDAFSHCGISLISPRYIRNTVVVKKFYDDDDELMLNVLRCHLTY